MAANHLEQLLAEWYEYQGYFLRRNVNVGKRPQGGWECELDIVAFHPEKGHLVHIEASLDADSWDRREQRFKRKFDLGEQHIPQLFKGMTLPTSIERQAVLLFASTTNRKTIGGGTIRLVPEVLAEILQELRTKSIAQAAVPEHHPILRTLQFVAHYRQQVAEALAATT